MLELHSNYTPDGLTSTDDGTLASNHAVHETIEVTHGFTSWFEVGAYLFTSVQGGQGLAWVGDHIRPRIRVPESWKWPVGVSLSTEVGYARSLYAADQWSWEIRPIVDKQWGRFYWSVNPALEIALSGPDKGQSPVFAPNVKVALDLTRVVTFGFEYYGSFGPLSGFLPAQAQEQSIYPAIDLNLGADWEFNAGVGIGLTDATDKTVLKIILGRRFGGKPAVGH